MRATPLPTVTTVAGSEAARRRDVIIRPAPVAMVWQGPGLPFAAIAVPGVSLGAGDVLVAVELATVCPSDLDAIVHGREVSPRAVPVVLGHEQVGRVVATGPDAATGDGSRLVVGMRVVWSRRIGCGECAACRDGRTSACANAREYGSDRLRRGWELSGGFATHVLVRAGTTVLTVPEIVPAAVLAPLSCATALAAAAVERVLSSVDVRGGTAVVVGADLTGLTVAAMLADEGADVVVVDADPTRRSRALDFGACGVAGSVVDLERILRADGGSGVHGVLSGRRLGAPVAVVESGGRRDDAGGDDPAGDDPVGDGAVGDDPVGDDRAGDDREGMSGAFAAVLVVVRLRDTPGRSDSRVADEVVPSEVVAGPVGPVGATVETLHRSEARHLLAAVDFASNAWFRYPFAALVGERIPLERLQDAVSDAAGAVSLRLALDPAVGSSSVAV